MPPSPKMVLLVVFLHYPALAVMPAVTSAAAMAATLTWTAVAAGSWPVLAGGIRALPLPAPRRAMNTRTNALAYRNAMRWWW